MERKSLGDIKQLLRTDRITIIEFYPAIIQVSFLNNKLSVASECDMPLTASYEIMSGKQ